MRLEGIRIPVEQLVEPVERALASVAWTADSVPYAMEQTVPLSWTVYHPTLGDIGQVRLEGTSERTSTLHLEGRWNAWLVRAGLSKRRRRIVDDFEAEQRATGDKRSEAWSGFMTALVAQLLEKELPLIGAEGLAGQPARQEQGGRGKPRGGRPKGSGMYPTTRAFLAALKPVLEKLAVGPGISQERAAEALNMPVGTLKHNLARLKADRGITWEQLRNEALGF